VNGRPYDIYPYEGRLSDVKHLKLLLRWEKGRAVGEPSLCILSTDCSLDFVTIQEYYDVRWNIETGYRFFKDLLGFDQYQLLSTKGIERFWELEFLTYDISGDPTRQVAGFQLCLNHWGCRASNSARTSWPTRHVYLRTGHRPKTCRPSAERTSYRLGSID
jgi:hypothetical protein